jgi:hypothetical protein
MATRYNYTGGIVTNGLVLNLDAAKTDSYPGTGTTWRDLSGRGNNGTLTNGPTFSGIGKQASIVFDGSNEYINTTFKTSDYFGNNDDITVSVWFNQVDNSQRSFIGNSVYLGSGWMVFNYFGQIRFATYGNPGGIISVLGINDQGAPINKWHNVTFTIENSVGKGYYNGELKNTTSPIGYTANSLNTQVGGTTQGGVGKTNGKISNVQVYNRALTAQEVSQNFNALRGRYGI